MFVKSYALYTLGFLIPALVITRAARPFHFFAPVLDQFSSFSLFGRDGLPLKSRQSCPEQYHACTNLDASGLCCISGTQCQWDRSGQVACCPTGAICTGTVTGIASPTNILTSRTVSPIATDITVHQYYATSSASFSNIPSCTAAFGDCQSNFAKCTAALREGPVLGLFASAPFARIAGIETNATPNCLDFGSQFCFSDGRVGYVPQDSRGTYDLLESCLSAIILSTYTALRLNIPREDLSAFNSFLRKSGWLIVVLIFPELLTCRAIYEYRMVKKSSVRRTISFYTLMGGFNNINNHIHAIQDDDRDDGQDAVLEKDLRDRNKVNSISRIITLLQILWVVLDVLGRLAQHLTVSTLEVATIGYIFCAIITYILWWEKPSDVDCRMNDAGRTRAAAGIAPLTDSAAFRKTFADQETDSVWLTLCLFTIVFGAIHLTAWAYPFQTEIERILWRVSAVVMTVYPIFLTPALIVLHSVMSPRAMDGFSRFLVLLIPYILVRMFIICEVFICLRSVPLNVYKQVAWTKFIPHF